MAKVPFSKLQVCINGCDTSNFYYNKDGNKVWYDVRHYLPMKEKMELVSRVINQSVDENGFYNPMRVKLFLVLEMVYAYTNLSFTEKQKEDPFKLYDLLVSTGIFQDIINHIFEGDWEVIQSDIWTTIKNIYDYRNSVYGILDTISTDYESLNFDVSDMHQKLSDPTTLGLLRDVIEKLG